MIVVMIAGQQVFTQGLAINDVLTSQANTSGFSLRDPEHEPVPGQEVTVWRDDPGTILFGGVIVQVSKSHPSPGSVMYAVQCMDYQRLLDRELVFEVYENMTCREIIQAMITGYTDTSLGFTTAHVQDGPVVEKAVFNYQTVSQCIKELAELVSYDWYVDDSRDIHFFEQENSSAPFVIDDDALATKVDGYQIAPDYSQVRNLVYVRGGYTLSDPYPETHVAQNGQTVFKLGYKPHELSMTVNGVPKSVGIEFLDDETSFDFMMNYQESTVRVAAGGTAPASGDVLAFTYRYEVPILVYVQDYASQQAIASLEGGTGVYAHVVVDDTMRSKEEAYSRAKSEIGQFANPWVTGSFITYEHGFKSGQTVEIAINGERYNGRYRIRNVSTRVAGNNVLVYTVTYATTIFDLVDVLAGLINDQRRVQLREDEVVDRLEFATETIMIAESHEVSFSDHPTKWGTKKWGLFSWG